MDDGPFVEKPSSKQRQPAKRKKQAEPFVKVPLWWIAAAAKATVAGHLGHGRAVARCLEGQERPFRFRTAGWPKLGASREVKRRVLRDLEQGGLIAVERPPRKTPIVTLILL